MSQISRIRVLQTIGAAVAAPALFGRRASAFVTQIRVDSDALTGTSRSAHVRLRSVDMDSVQWKGGFWAERFANNGATMMTFDMAAGGPPIENYVMPYSGGDWYKWLEAVARWPKTAIRRTPGRATSPAFCCPPNALRMLASMHEYMYSLSDDTVWVSSAYEMEGRDN